MNAPVNEPDSPAHGSFPTTQWSLVLNADSPDSAEVRDALEALCRRYWYPIYVFVRRHGYAHHEAEDCTQEFLARLIATGAVTRARPERGRFRAFLATSLRHFLVNRWHKATTAKRGGNVVIESLDWRGAENRFAREPIDAGLTPEQAFDRAWTLEMIDWAKRDLGDEYRRTGRAAIFKALAPLLFQDAAVDSIANAAATLQLSPHAVTTAVHRLRRRLGERLRLHVAETVGSAADVDDELRALIAICGLPTPVA